MLALPMLRSPITRRLLKSNPRRGEQETTTTVHVLTNFCGVVRGTEDEFGCPIIPGADIRHVGLVLHQYLGATEIAEFQDARVGVEEEVLGLDVSVADALRMDVGEGAEQLVDIQLHLEGRHRGLHLVEKARRSIDCLGNEFLHEVEVDFVFLSIPGPSLVRGDDRRRGRNSRRPFVVAGTHPLSIRVVEGFQLNDVRMSNNPHDLQFAVLRFQSVSAKRIRAEDDRGRDGGSHTLKRLS